MKTISTLLILFSLAFYTRAQVNGYASVTSIQSGRKLTISVSDETYGMFKKYGFVIIMQMQDNVIGTNTLNNSNFGDLSTIASAGEYEIARISSVKRDDGDSDDDDDDNSNAILEIKLSADLAKTFINGTNSSVQVITYPTLGTSGFTTTANISALPWNGSYGGVVAFEVNGTLTLNHHITADNAGFRGAVMDASSSPYGSCNSSTYFTAVDALFGNKGEGIYKSVDPLYAAGKGKILNGGGGGNTINGGGSGGGNFSGGGNGGAGWSCALNTGGMGGIALNSYINGTRLFLGGGGGSGESNDYNNDKGGNGGGIIIIKAQEIRTTGTGAVRISANGQAGNGVSNDGAGGGGAGGSIAFQVNNWNVAATNPLQITTNGGNGGNVNNGASHGGGGGGGQGAILFNTPVPVANITVNSLNGIGGLNYTGGTRASDGTGSNNAGIMQHAFGLLPLKLISFQGYKNSSKVELQWKSQNEINVLRFEIQRSSNGTSFSAIGNQQASVNSQSINSYSFTDAQPLTGANYYRLRMIDNDGKFTYSKVLLIRGDEQTKQSIGIYPNPAVSQATLYFKSEKSGSATIHILSMKGALIAKQNIQVVNGENALALSGISNLPAGVYNVQLIVGNTPNHTRLIVQK
ncbi:MAG: T9SS type A sorting domain-containing protein [Chitinophagaceae bacterium]|nr:T9SS type A sorting domain-containing protein [Chitinophagaceae bacterium]